MIGDYIKDSYNYIKNNFSKFLIGGILSLISGIFLGVMTFFISYLGNLYDISRVVFLIPIFIIMFIILLTIIFIISGYYVRVMKNTVENKEAPDWDNIWELFVSGLLYTVGMLILSIIFLIIPFIIILMAILFININTKLSVLTIILGLLLFIPFILCLTLYQPLASVNFSVNGFFGFFEFRKIFKLMSLKYVLLLIVVFIISFIVNLIISIPFIILKIVFLIANSDISFMIADILESTVSLFVSFFLGIFSYRCYSLYYKDKIGER
ncbi:hypothetical protein J422_06733 [Methanocaldococcus villosus KIN24-T80]|uniref:Glycerophosphoryl diester phosphodiesterase membrane domain-containing protein n=1 Tax=Methanocaldococcus villosus KIN24-T80 TaxID=1069083 RepID=N6VX09_9EURY|nr:DUF4013 domain-containing protein [Methanocaldococcus villosus]ENN95642.1 hypothetical protein J422_06733 [Methanocaldococcus villosus KIN24-T80]